MDPKQVGMYKNNPTFEKNKEENSEGKILIVGNCSALSLRSRKSKSAELVKPELIVRAGEKVKVLKDDGEWSKVRTEKGTEAFVVSEYLIDKDKED